MKRDTLYAETPAAPGSFRFDEAVVSVFPDMIRRSVPGYEATLALTGRLATRYAQDHSAVVDLGCSLGDSLLACARALEGRPVTLLGVDNAAPMIAQAEARFAALALTPSPRFEQAELEALAFPPASLFILNWTLQFLPREARDPLMARLFAALRPGGALVLSEKIRDPDPKVDTLLGTLHHDFKAAQGYSPAEIEGKRQALETVLVRETVAEHEARLRQAGFTAVTVLLQQLNFVTLLALKPHAA
jgi:tRNA (cmo5U34)-methyltransferase